MNPKLSENWEGLSDFITFRNTLSSLQEILSLDSVFEPPLFVDQITTFLAAVSSHSKVRSQSQSDLLGILSIDTLLNNLYMSCRNGQSFQPRSSSFYGWMSSSQMSMDQSNVSEREGQLITKWIESLSSSENFFNQLKLSLGKRNQEKVKKYVECLLQTIDTVLVKEKMNRQRFLKLRGKYVGLQSRQKWQIPFAKINQILFSSHLNKITAILAEGADYVHLSLLRIYLSFEDSQIFEGSAHNGEEMLTNIYRYYIYSYKSVDQLFEEGKNPIFRFLKNHFVLLFTPLLKKFHKMIVRIASKCGFQSGYNFFKNGNVLQAEITEFINEWPVQLTQLLSMLKQLILQQHPSQLQSSLSAIKKMLIYSFLVDQLNIQELCSRHDPRKYSVVYNNLINLFFQGALKKYNNLPSHQLAHIQQIIKKISSLTDSKINRFDKEDLIQQTPLKCSQSLLNHDYEVVINVLSSLQFTPKDSKIFDMKKNINSSAESPVYKHLKGQNFQTQEATDQIELATWMSVGGSREWGPRLSGQRKRGIAEKLKGLKTISLKKRIELQQESEIWGQFLKK